MTQREGWGRERQTERERGVREGATWSSWILTSHQPHRVTQGRKREIDREAHTVPVV